MSPSRDDDGWNDRVGVLGGGDDDDDGDAVMAMRRSQA